MDRLGENEKRKKKKEKKIKERLKKGTPHKRVRGGFILHYPPHYLTPRQ